MTTMSVTRALAELKRLDDRINRAVTESNFVAVSVGTDSQLKLHGSNGVSVVQAKENIQSAFDGINSMFKQRRQLKSALVRSNATTNVTIGAETYTVAEAIELKKSIDNKRALLHALKRQQVAAQSTINQLNAQLEAAIDSNLKTVYGSDKSKVDKDSYELIAKPQRSLKEAALVDPMDILAKIKTIEEEISVVDTELDFTLSEVNAKTEIQF